MTETTTTRTDEVPPVNGAPPSAGTRTRRRGALRTALSPGRTSIVYLYVLGFVLFSLWIPDVWLSDITHRSVLNIAFAVPGIAALALLLPLSAGAFDLSVAGTISATAVTTASLMVNNAWGMWSAIAAGMVVALVAGLVNGLLVVVVGIDSFIATLATNAVLLAYAEWKSGGIQITGFSQDYVDLSAHPLFGGIQIKVLYLAVLAVILWYVMEHTPFGRYLQATGDNAAAARLAGVRTSRYVYISLVASALIAGAAGIIQTSTIGAGSATAGNSFLLPAFAAAFLGATQFKRRFNVWGTLAAIWVLASGVQGVTLAVGSFSWLNNLFFGVALIIAVGMSSLLVRWQGFRASRARIAVARDGSDTTTTPAQGGTQPEQPMA